MEKFKFSAVVFTADVSRHFLPDVGEVDFVLDFASLKIPKNPLVVDFDHDSAAPIGSALVKVDSDGLTAVGELVSLAPNDRAASIAASGRDIPFGISPTLDLSAAELVEVAGGSQYVVNGRYYEGPLVVVRNAVLLGISVVLYPTDSGTIFTPLKKKELVLMAREKMAVEEKAVEKVEKVEKIEPIGEESAAPETGVKDKELQNFIDAFGLERGVRYFQEGKTFEEARADAFDELVQENAKLKARIAELEAAAGAPEPEKKPEDAVEEKTVEERVEEKFSKPLEALDATLAKLDAWTEKIENFRARGDYIGLSASVPAPAPEEEKAKSYRDALREALNK